MRYVIGFLIEQPRVNGTIYRKNEPLPTTAYERTVEAATCLEAVAAAAVEFAGRRIVKVSSRCEDAKED